MQSRQQITKILPLVTIALFLILTGSALHSFTTDTLAQGVPQPTPTNTGGGGGGGGSGGEGGDDSSDTIPAPAGARVSGFVYDYSNASYEAGVIVVIDGGDWQLETTTDSNGFYQFVGLGVSRAVLNLRLPPGGPQPATLDWPVRLVSEADEQVNLGYYWGDNPPIPVILWGNVQSDRLDIQIENRTPLAATGGLVAILPPTNLKVSPPIEIDEGNVASFNPRYFQINVDDIPAGKSATINALLKNTETAVQANPAARVRVVFTYDQQITPQVIEIDLSDPLEPAVPSFDQSKDTQETILDQATSPEEDPLQPSVPPEPVQSQIQATPSNQTASQASILSTPNPPSPAPPQSQTQTSISDQATPEPAPPALSQTQDSSEREATPQPIGITPLPTTGSTPNSTNFIKLSLSALLVLGLSIGGWRSLRAKR